MRTITGLPALALVIGLAACGQGQPSGGEASGPAEGETTSAAAPTAEPTTVSPSPTPTTEAVLAGRTIAIDPGHNGANGKNPSIVNAHVPDGRGGTKACNTTGTSTNGGYPEHAFNWELAGRLTELLEEAGAEVVLSRDSDDGVGPCVDERGQFSEGADMLLSIHANGTENSSAHGFHIIVGAPGAAADEGALETSESLAEDIVDSLESADFSRNEAYGRVVSRSDLATLNHSPVPAVMIEAGEMRNADDAAELESEEGQDRMAEALYEAIAAQFGEGGDSAGEDASEGAADADD